MKITDDNGNCEFGYPEDWMKRISKVNNNPRKIKVAPGEIQFLFLAKTNDFSHLLYFSRTLGTIDIYQN